MIQFIKFATIDPEGFALVKLEDISGFQTAMTRDEKDYCRLITRAETYLVQGNMEYFIDMFRNVVGGEIDMIPENVA